jgi:phosphoribosylamine---glycine ligase
MKVLVVGAGGREHALAWRLAGEGNDVLVAPGNGGTARNVPIQVTDVAGLVALARRESVDLTVVGPEAPLASGLVDSFCAAGLTVFGPTRAAARLEWSKAFAKAFVRRHGIPTAWAEVVDDEAGARRVIARVGLPVVLKADGLAAGKGVFVALTTNDLETAIDQLFRRRAFGTAASQVLVEEYLSGAEMSVLAFTDGERFALMPPARDYKRLLEGDLGPNTGGMGGVTWPEHASRGLLDEVQQRVIRPALAGMAGEGHPYRGVLYAGLMLTADGPRVLEFNSRFGDPECQLILPLVQGSLSEMCASVAAGSLQPEAIDWAAGRTYGVVLAAPGYPEAPRVGEPIGGLDMVPHDVRVFHAGTRRLVDGSLVTSGGRVLTVVSANRDAVYAAADAIRFPGRQFRADIGRARVAAGVGQ